LGAVFPHFCPDKREIWHGGGSAPPCQILRLSGNVSPLRGEKPIFGLLSKNNTGMAALHAGLSETRNQYASPPRQCNIGILCLCDFDEILCR